MAILIFPIALVAGWLFRSPKWAVAVMLAIGVAALVALWLLWLAGAMVSPLETLVLAFGTPIAAIVAYRIASWRGERHTIRRA